MIKILKSIRRVSLFLACLLAFGNAYAQQDRIIENGTFNSSFIASKSIILRNMVAKPGFSAIISNSVNCNALVSYPSDNYNYIIGKTFKIPGVKTDEDVIKNIRSTCQENQTIQYFDGLGRILQTIDVLSSPNGYDKIQPFAYDDLGREQYTYAPYTINDKAGSYHSAALTTELISFYQNPSLGIKSTEFPYEKSVFESSDLDRKIEEGFQGQAWQLSSGHTKKTEYGTNKADEVVRYLADDPDNIQDHVIRTILRANKTYNAGSLFVTTTKDENWVSSDSLVGTVKEYKSIKGEIILKRSFSLDANNNIQQISTYYVYDDFDNLNFVLTPAVNPDGGSVSQDQLDKFCYQYRYDERDRLVEKRIPGMDGWSEMVYNKSDQLVFSQDPLQRSKKTRSFIKYDGMGRVIMTGTINNSTDERATLQTAVNNWTVSWDEKSDGVFHGYTNNNPLSGSQVTDVEIVNYYDDYNIPAIPKNESGNFTNKTQGLLTASKTKVLGKEDYLWTINYYDEEGRIAKQYKQHYLTGSVDLANYDEVINSWNFAGELVQSTRNHYASGNLLAITDNFDYDNAGRLVDSYQKINGQDKVLLRSNVYNELSQLYQKSLHNNKQTTAYSYNERGWLKNSTSNEFSIQLKYEDSTFPRFNGDISNQYWGSGTSLDNVFTYKYDKQNRLISGEGNGMSEVVSYDIMGNIQSLNRDGNTRTYTYSGNRLLKTIIGTITGNYEYDANGNTTTDGRNGQKINYNRLNLPETVPGLKLTYLYDGSGKKLKKTSNVDVIDYIDGIQYTNGKIDFIKTSEGIARRNETTYSYEYNLTDNLGNVRYTFHQNPVSGKLERLQSDDYYPFGLRKLVQAGTNNYLYNGKELQEELGQYDYGARFYDPVIGRFNTIDPLAEKGRRFSPYVYGNNNSIRFIDPDGMEPEDIIYRNRLTDKEVGRTILPGDNITKYTDAKNIDELKANNFDEPKISASTSNVQAYQSVSVHNFQADQNIDYQDMSQSTTSLAVAKNVVSFFAYEYATAKLVSGASKFLNATKSSYVNFASSGRTAHILAGDATGGGHSWFGSLKSFTNGLTGSKSMFPATWSGGKIMNSISEVAVNNTWVQQTGKVGATLTKSGQPVRYMVEGVSQGTKIRVITTANDIITAFPIK